MFTNTPTIKTFRISRTIGTLRWNFTKLPRKTFFTVALKVTFFRLNAVAAVQTWCRLTLVDDLIAIVAAKAGPALARIRAVVVEAHAAVLTWIARALVDVLLAEASGVAGAAALARESAHLVDAHSAVLARLRFAVVEIRFASRAEEAIQALTLVGFTVGWNATRSVIEAWILLAQRMRLDRRLAECSGEAGGAETLVVADAVFFAIAAVPARILFAR